MATITITSGSWAVDATLTIGVGVPGADGVGVPTGGTTGQVLAKASATNYDTEWVNVDDVAAVWGGITGTLSDQTDLQTALNLKADLASPALTGNPTAPTAATGDNDTTIATTGFVQQELAAGTAVAKNLEIEVRNQTGATLDAGAIVYISGATGNKATVSKAIATGDATSAQTLGFVKEAIVNNGTGKVIVRGTIENIDTSALAEGQQLYLSGTTAGTWQTTKPQAPVHLVYVGIVTRSHPTLGTIEVAIQNGAEIGELHDVAITSPTNGQVLKYDSATELWVNGTIASGATWGSITGTLSAQTDLQNALDGKASLTGATFTGKVNLPASTTSSAFLNFGAGSTPTSPVNGDLWLSSNDLFVHLNGTTQAMVNAAGSQTISGSKSFSNTALWFGTSSVSTTINVANGATISGQTKTLNLGTGGGAGSTTAITVGSASGTSTTSFLGVTSSVTPSTSDDSTRVATTAFVKAQGYVGTATANTFTTNQIISLNSTSPGLRITQTGTGNALTVEDSNNPDSTPFVVDQSGNVAIGSTSPFGYKLYVVGSANFSTGISTNNIILGGDSIYNAIGNFIFSGQPCAVVTQQGTANVDFTDPFTSTYYYSGGTDYNGSEIPVMNVSTTPVSINYDIGANAFIQTFGETTYVSYGDTLGSFYTDGVGYVDVQSDGTGGLMYIYST